MGIHFSSKVFGNSSKERYLAGLLRPHPNLLKRWRLFEGDRVVRRVGDG